MQKFTSTHWEFSLCFLKWCNTDFNPNLICKKMTNSCGEWHISFEFLCILSDLLGCFGGSQGIVQFRILRILLGENKMSDGKSTKDQISQKPLWSFRQYCLFNLHFHQSFQINIIVDITGSFANLESFLPKLIFKNWQEMGFSQLERKNYKDISKRLCFANMVWH